MSETAFPTEGLSAAWPPAGDLAATLLDDCERLLQKTENEARLLHGKVESSLRDLLQRLGMLCLNFESAPPAVRRDVVQLALRGMGIQLFHPFGAVGENLVGLFHFLQTTELDERLELLVRGALILLDAGLSPAVEDVELTAHALRQQSATQDGLLCCLLAGILYYQIGSVAQGMQCYDMYICRYEYGNDFLHNYFCLKSSTNALYLHNHSQAYGIIESFKTTNELCGGTLFSLRWKSHLAFLLLDVGRLEEALVHIESLTCLALAEKNPLLSHLMCRALALYHFKNGHARHAALVIRNHTLRYGMDTLLHGYTSPAVVEMLDELDSAHPQLTAIPFAVEEERLRHEGNRLLYGVAQRCRARRLARAGRLAQALEAYDTAFSSLQSTGCLAELSATGTAYRALLEQAGEHEQAGRLGRLLRAADAEDSGRRDKEDARSLPHDALRTVRTILERLAEARAFTQARERMQHILGIVQTVFRAQRSVLFRFSDGGAAEFLQGRNITRTEFTAKAFQEKLRPLPLRHAGPTAGTVAGGQDGAVCFALPVTTACPWFLYMDNHLEAGTLPTLSPDAGELLCATLAAELRPFALGPQLTATPPRETPRNAPRQPVYWGESLRELLNQAERAALSRSPVLIYGETGVGKECLARYIHESGQHGGGFVPVQLSCLPEQLFESEMFGYEKGAFTGAVQRKAGRVEQADGGVLFLDEIGDIPPFAQVKLLRLLQEHEYTRVGGVQTRHADFRLIAATHRDLRQEVLAGRFREDLYYRIAVITLTIPPLRQRPADILPLAGLFHQHFSRLNPLSGGSLSERDKARLLRHTWPGNVRELRNVVERSVVLNEPCRPGTEGAPAPQIVPPPPPARTEEPLSLDAAMTAHVACVLRRTGGRLYGPDGALALLGVSKATFYRRWQHLLEEVRQSRTADGRHAFREAQDSDLR